MVYPFIHCHFEFIDDRWMDGWMDKYVGMKVYLYIYIYTFMHSVPGSEDTEAKGTPTGEVKPSRKTSISQIMAIYDGNFTVYDFLPEVKFTSKSKTGRIHS